ncbi:dnaJ homolog subfamily B member 14-like [Papaver somniferum]|uniref:dnaJ homolog subfamily B member 14-like n=1 Tax=Papaver somniferum TaxID=3469 RepID=UPI000E6FFDDE|nr:dnaJ homolog subfamily B member 14-like [Papaver somniferum]
MEGNREEAVRAKELSEKKMNSKDYVGAQILISKAQKLYPSMENLSRMLTVCQVHCSTERQVEPGSVPDWYDILQIEQTADEASIKKQFRHLALLLHPDKNKFSGAGAAFQLIEEANRFLCDQSKRSQFDTKRRTMKQRQSQNQPRMNNYPSKNPVSTEMAALFKRMNPPQQKQQQQTQPVYANGQQTFWTMCPFCSIRYQYYIDIMYRALAVKLARNLSQLVI